MAKKEALEFKRTINAPPSEVFLAVTNPAALREWFSELAQIEPRRGGRVCFAWHPGYYAAGEVTQIKPSGKLAFTSAGRGEPDTNKVEVPATAAELAEAARKMYASADAELASAMQEVSESEAALNPAPGEWGAAEALAHLVLAKRDGHAWLAELVAGDDRVCSQAGGSSQLGTQATATTYNSASAQFEELKRNESETVAMLAALPGDFVSRKRSYRRAANGTLLAGDHTREHTRQIAAAAATARQPR